MRHEAVAGAAPAWPVADASLPSAKGTAAPAAFIPTRALAARLGVSSRTALRWLLAAGAPLIRPSKRTVLVPAAWVDAWLASRMEVPSRVELRPDPPRPAARPHRLPTVLRAARRALGEEL